MTRQVEWVDPEDEFRAAGRFDRPWIELHVPVALLVASMIGWVVSLSIMNVDNLGDYGLVPRFPILFFVSLTMISGSFFLTLTRRVSRPWLLALHVVGLIFMLHGSAPLLFDEPRYPWVYKHFGVVEYIRLHHRLDTDVDIYQNFPGFFAGGAWLADLMGLDAVRFGGWSQVFFNLVYLLELSFIFRGLNVNYRVRWLAIFIFFTCNWVGQDYFSPQAFAFMLALAIYGVTITWMMGQHTGPITWVVQKALPVKGVSFMARMRRRSHDAMIMPVLVVCSLFAVIVITHQLSPYMVLIGFGALMVLGGQKPRWLVLILAALALGYLALHYDFIRTHFGPLFGGGGDPLANAKSNGQQQTPSPGVGNVANAIKITTLSVWALGILGFVRRLRNGHRELTVGALALAPFVVLGGQSYGGEAIFRVYLFALPWFSLLAAYAVLPKRMNVTAFFVGIRTCAFALGLTLFLFSYFGLEQVYRVTPNEVAAVDYFYDNAPVKSAIYSVGQGLPMRASGRYDLYYDVGAIRYPKKGDHVLGPADMDAVTQITDRYKSGPSFFEFSRAARVYGYGYGSLMPGSYEGLQRAFAEDPRWQVWYQNADVIIYQRVSSSA